MDYTAILKRGLEITVKHKALWVFGFLVALTEATSSINARIPRFTEFVKPEALSRTQAMMLGYVTVLLCCLVLFIALILTVLSYIGHTALIGMVKEIEGGGTPGVREGFQEGFSREAFKLFLLDLMLGIPLSIIAIGGLVVVTGPFLLGLLVERKPAFVGGILVSGVLFLGFVLVMMVLSAAARFLATFAWRECVIGKKGLVESLTGGFRVIQNNLKDAGIMWLLLLGIGIGWGLVSLPLNFILLFIAVGGGGTVWAFFHLLKLRVISWIAGGLVGMVLLVIPSAFINGLYQVFTSSTWTLTYLELMGRGQNPGGYPS